MEKMEILSIFITIFTGILSAVYTMIIKNLTKKNNSRSETLIFELKKANDHTNNNPSNSVDKSNDVKLNGLIYEHHSQALSQSKIQFWFSLIAAIVGFIFIILMVCFTATDMWYEYIVRILPGAIIEAVSILFFSQSREARERSSDFLNRLREDKQYEKGIAIAESISDEQLKSKLKAEIALRLCGINDINIFEDEKNNK